MSSDLPRTCTPLSFSNTVEWWSTASPIRVLMSCCFQLLLRHTYTGTDELQQHCRAHSVGENAAAAAAAAGQPTKADLLLEKSLDLLLVLAHADSVVKGIMCSKDNLQHLLDLTQRLQTPGLLKVGGSRGDGCHWCGVACPNAFEASL